MYLFLSFSYSIGSSAKNKLGKCLCPLMLHSYIVSYKWMTFDIWPWCSGAQAGSSVDEQLSSSSIFEHVDRLSRGSSDGTRRVSNKIQLIAMQPMPSPPSHPHNQALSPNLTDNMPDGAKVNSEVSRLLFVYMFLKMTGSHLRHRCGIYLYIILNIYILSYFFL